MLIPQFSLRWVLGITAAFGLLSLVLALARGGSNWAMGVTIAVASLALTMLIHGGMFFLVWLFSLVWPSSRRGLQPIVQSPFQPGFSDGAPRPSGPGQALAS